jgi:protein-S-isoprenylcysteine O-methyltransferase Ste14
MGATDSRAPAGFLKRFSSSFSFLKFLYSSSPVFKFLASNLVSRLAITEENEMHKQFGATYDTYAQRTPRFIPRMGKAQSTTDSVSKR